MLQSILVPVDGSGISETVIPYAERIAQAAAAEMHYVRGSDLPPTQHDAEVLRRMSEIEDYLTMLRDFSTASGVESDIEALHMGGAEAILAAAAVKHADLIVMASHGRGGLARGFIGSVADRVLRESPVPTMVVQPGSFGPWSANRRLTFILPLDGSPLAEAAIPVAVDLATALSAKIVLVQAVGYEGSLNPLSLFEDRREEAKSYLHAMADHLAERHLCVETAVSTGMAAPVIIGTAEEFGADAIIMGSHGRSGPKRLLLGSVTDAILHRGNFPVVVVHPD